jgi:hypothetical protein
MSDNTLANEDTGSSETIQATSVKTYTQDEVNDMMARTKGAVQKKFEKTLADLGDIDELRQLRATHEQQHKVSLWRPRNCGLFHNHGRV